jgi:hypothetical protein
MENLSEQSGYVELITELFGQEFGKKVLITQFHTLKLGDGNSLFYVIVKGGLKFLVNVMGKTAPPESTLLYWIEEINHAGKLTEILYETDTIVVSFDRGDLYNGEHLVYLYVYGNRYPALRFVPKDAYESYLAKLSERFKKHTFELPDGL